MLSDEAVFPIDESKIGSLESFVLSGFYISMRLGLLFGLSVESRVLRDPFWLVNSHDYCALQGPVAREEVAGDFLGPRRSVQILFRHGARTEHRRSPCFLSGKRAKYECDEKTGFQLVSSGAHKSKHLSVTKTYSSDASSCSIGQLLDQGLSQAARLGQHLKRTYSEFSEDNLERITRYSTDTQRTMGTLSVVLEELFPLTAMPIPVSTSEFDEDIFALNIPSCPFFDELRRNYGKSELFQQTKRTSAFKQCAAKWKDAYKTELDLRYSDDCLLSAYCAGVPLPDGLLIQPEIFRCVMDISFRLRREKLGAVPESTYYNNGTRMCEIGSLKVFNELLRSVESNNVGGLYAIHDETFVCLLTHLGIWDEVWPKYAEYLAFEFYFDNTVRVVRNGRTLVSSIPINTLGGSESRIFDLCKLD